MSRSDKAAAIAELTEKFRSSNAAVLTEYRGLTVSQLTELRTTLRGNATYAVVKNTLTELAAKEAGVDAFEGQLAGPSAIAFVEGDPVSVAKSLRDFAKAHPLLVIKGGVLEGKALSEMVELSEAGCIGFSNAHQPIPDTLVLFRAMQYAATFDYPVWLSPQDAFLGRGGIAHDGEVASRLGLSGIPVSAETIAIATLVTLMRDTGARVHLMRLSSAAGVDLVRAAKAVAAMAGISAPGVVSRRNIRMAVSALGTLSSTSSVQGEAARSITSPAIQR